MKPIDAGLARESQGAQARPAQRQRDRLLSAFRQFREEGGGGSVLSVCAHGINHDSASSLAALLNGAVISCALDLSEASGKRRYARSDGRQLLYGDGEFDFVYCEGLLEHAGNFERQFELLKEMNRVARKGLFVSTANRRHPLDQVSMLPLLHWLPPRAWQAIAPGAAQGRHLLDVQANKRLVSLLPGQPDNKIGHIRWMGPKAQFFLMVKKEA